MNKVTQQSLLDLVKRNYQEISVDFDATRKKYLWPELIELAKPVPNGARVLDAGCGNGRLLTALASKKIDYVGVDNSEPLITTAKNNWQLNNSLRQGDWKFINFDILSLAKLPEKDFDYIFCLAVLHHLPGENLRIKTLELLKDKLKPQGKIIITVWNLWPKAKFNKLIYKFAILKILGRNKMDFGDIMFNWKNSQAESVSRRYYHAFTRNELKKIIQRAELKIEKLYKDKYNYYAVLIK